MMSELNDDMQVLPPDAESVAVLDTVSAEGTVEGWALYRLCRAPVHVQVQVGGIVVAEDVADKYRPDLMLAGLGHGHYAFYAPLRGLSAGPHDFVLHDGRTGAEIGSRARGILTAPAIKVPAAWPVETMLAGRPGWTDADLAVRPQCLQLEENYTSLGADRFVDRVFRFVLGRWADLAGGAHYMAALRSGEMSPEEVFLAVISSDERKARPVPLVRPFDGAYPFSYDVVRAVASFGL